MCVRSSSVEISKGQTSTERETPFVCTRHDQEWLLALINSHISTHMISHARSFSIYVSLRKVTLGGEPWASRMIIMVATSYLSSSNRKSAPRNDHTSGSFGAGPARALLHLRHLRASPEAAAPPTPPPILPPPLLPPRAIPPPPRFPLRSAIRVHRLPCRSAAYGLSAHDCRRIMAACWSCERLSRRARARLIQPPPTALLIRLIKFAPAWVCRTKTSTKKGMQTEIRMTLKRQSVGGMLTRSMPNTPWGEGQKRRQR